MQMKKWYHPQYRCGFNLDYCRDSHVEKLRTLFYLIDEPYHVLVLVVFKSFSYLLRDCRIFLFLQHLNTIPEQKLFLWSPYKERSSSVSLILSSFFSIYEFFRYNYVFLPQYHFFLVAKNIETKKWYTREFKRRCWEHIYF